MTISNIKKVALQDRLGGVLGPSWDVFGAVLGCKNIEKPLVSQASHETRLLGKKCIPRAILDRSWANLGPQKGQDGTQNGTQNGTKNDPKNDQNLKRFWRPKKLSRGTCLSKEREAGLLLQPVATCASGESKRSSFVQRFFHSTWIISWFMLFTSSKKRKKNIDKPYLFFNASKHAKTMDKLSRFWTSSKKTRKPWTNFMCGFVKSVFCKKCVSRAILERCCGALS